MKRVNLSNRLISALIDFIIIIAVGSLFLILLIVFKLENNLIFQAFVISFLTCLFLYKDIFNGQSVGKNFTNLRIVSNDNDVIPIFRIVLRNFFIFLWPIDIILCLINPEKRLGDYIAMSKVVMINSKVRLTIGDSRLVLIYVLTTLVVSFAIYYSLLFVLVKYNGLFKLLYM
jgi:uncharacterized RDD family membrane protein YckC